MREMKRCRSEGHKLRRGICSRDLVLSMVAVVKNTLLCTCVLAVANTWRPGRDKWHTFGESEKIVYFVLVPAQWSHLQRLSLEPWCLLPFMVGIAGARREKKGGYWSVVLCGHLADAGSKITEAKSMQGEYPVLDIWLAPFFTCPCQLSFSLKACWENRF